LIGRTKATLEKSKKELAAEFPKTTTSIHSADITSIDSMKSVMQEIREQAGKPLNVLVHSAAYLATTAPIGKLDAGDFATAMRINIEGSFNVAQAFLAVAEPKATLVNITSGNAFVPTAVKMFGAQVFRGMVGYSTGKLGSLKVFENVQLDYPETRVFNVQPGVIASDIASKANDQRIAANEPPMPVMDTGT
jgi:NAD(P)-dependent dehydrogenase (short-subunit alcohol dehydrogenase family)